MDEERAVVVEQQELSELADADLEAVSGGKQPTPPRQEVRIG